MNIPTKASLVVAIVLILVGLIVIGSVLISVKGKLPNLLNIPNISLL